MAVNVTGFQRMRRLAAEKAAKKAEKEFEQEYGHNPGDSEDLEQKGLNTKEQSENAAAGENKQENERQIGPNDVDDMDIEGVKNLLDQMEIKYAHNTGEKKLKEKLKEAL